jgi:tripeptidyl-peptidase-1
VKAPVHDSTPDTAISAAAAALPAALQNCSTAITKACIQALYGIPDAPAAVPGNSLGLYEQGSYFAESDVNAYYAKYAPEIPQNTFPINASIDGGSYSVPASSAENSGEANIDIEMA